MSTQYPALELIEQISSEVVPPGAVALWWLGQASFVLKGDGVVIYLDPYLASSDARLSPPPFPPEAVTNADLVVVTHDHSDHVDPAALPALVAASPRARVVAPRPIAARVAALVGDPARVISASADEPLTVDVGSTRIELLPVPAKHEEFDLTPDGYPYLGYSLRLGGVCVHHSGDTIGYEGQAERVAEHGVDVALLPVNGRDFYRTRAGVIGNLDYREAGELAVRIGADVLIPMHYGMFRGNTAPPGLVASYLAEYHPEQAVHIMGRYGKYVHLGKRT